MYNEIERRFLTSLCEQDLNNLEFLKEKNIKIHKILNITQYYIDLSLFVVSINVDSFLTFYINYTSDKGTVKFNIDTKDFNILINNIKTAVHRIRIQHDIKNNIVDYILTIKIKALVGVYEFEYPIKPDDIKYFTNMHTGNIINKIRYVTSDMFEIDFYKSPSVMSKYIIAERELTNINENINTPTWCLYEITDISGISNKDISFNVESVVKKLENIYD